MNTCGNKHRFSFIIIGKNEGWKLSLCFQAVDRCVKNNHIENFETIYVDARSSDNSIVIAKENNVTRIFSVLGYCNAAIARNIGGKEATGDVLIFLDGDMELQSDFIPSFLKEDGMLVHSFVSGTICHSYYDNKWKFIENKTINRKTKNNFTCKVGGFFVITKELWLSVGGMDKRLDANEDLDLGLRIAKKGILLLQVAQVCLLHHTIAYTDNCRFKETVKRFCYVALLARKHFFSRRYWNTTFRMNYTSWLLAGALIGAYFSFYSCLLYVFVLTVRSFRNGICNAHRMFIFLLLRDIVFISSFIFFHPGQKTIKYNEISNLCY